MNSAPRSPRSAWIVPVATLVLELMGLAAAVLVHEPGGFLLVGGFATPVLSFAVVGGLISSRQPSNAVGWLLSTIGLMFALVVAGSAGAQWGLRGDHLDRAVWEWVAVAPNGWVVGLGLIGTQLALRLPNGRLPSRRWRWFSRCTVGLVAVATVGMAVQRGRVEGVRGTSNPLGWEVGEPLAGAFLLVILCFPISIASLVLRYRRSSGRDRAQLRWVAFSGVLFVLVYVTSLSALGLVDDDGFVGTVLTTTAQTAFAAFPIGIGFAVLRRDLYDIDVVINRAVVYGLLTATLAGTYVAGVLLLQLVLERLTQGSGLAVASSTLATAALVRPARATIQDVVDRRFFRRKYDAARTLESFGARVRDEVELDALTRDLRDVVDETMRPSSVSLWLRPAGGRA